MNVILYGRQHLFHCFPCVLPRISVVISRIWTSDSWKVHLLEVYLAVDLLCCCEAASTFCPVGLRWYVEGYKIGLRGVLEERA